MCRTKFWVSPEEGPVLLIYPEVCCCHCRSMLDRGMVVVGKVDSCVMGDRCVCLCVCQCARQVCRH